jgi:alginate O-acetyltransferase complex protein AlgI
MVFSSLVFLFLFLPVVLILYLLAPRSSKNVLLLAASLFFYSWGEQFLVWIILTSTAIDYAAGLVISGGYRRGPVPIVHGEGPRTGFQKLGLAASISGNLGFLAFFKYFNFGIDGFNAIVPAAWGLHDVAQIGLPIGISFYTFQSMSYTIDVYRGAVRATRNFLDFACYVTLFPQLVAGPIVRYRDISDQLVERTVDLESFASGVRRFIIGLGKKVLVANVVAIPVDRIYGVSDQFGVSVASGIPLDALTAPVAWLGAICFTIQIYFDFSGYSDMAIGLGRMFGFRFLENFNYPYASTTIREFWRRWHISLSGWFRDYVFISLGGSRRSSTRTYRNLLIVFVLCGLWHGAAWTFLAWGLYHGSFLVFERLGFERWIRRRWRPLQHSYTLLVVIVGWVLFRAESFAQATAMLGAMFGFTSATESPFTIGGLVTHELLWILPLGILGSLPWIRTVSERLATTERLGNSTGSVFVNEGLAFGAVALLAAIWLASAASLAAGAYNPFIYFRF